MIKTLLVLPDKNIENSFKRGRLKGDHAYRGLNLAIFWVLKFAFNLTDNQSAQDASKFTSGLADLNSEIDSLSASYIRKLVKKTDQPFVSCETNRFIFDGILRNVSESKWEDELANKAFNQALLFTLRLTNESLIELTPEAPDEYGFVVRAAI